MTLGHLNMQQVIADGLGSEKIVIPTDDVSAVKATLVQRSFRGLSARGRAASLWIAAAFLVTWASETRGFSEERRAQADARDSAQSAIAVSNVDFGGIMPAHDGERVLAGRFDNQPVRLAQATIADSEELQKALQQEHDRVELLARVLAVERYLETLLTLQRAHAESARLSARFMQPPNSAELLTSPQRDRDWLRRTAEGDIAKLCKSSPDHRADRLEQDLAAARRSVETQAAVATKAKEQASEQTQAAAGLHNSLQQEREQTGRLERELAATRREAEMQKALAGKSSEEAGQCKQAGETNAVKLQASLQEQQQRAEQLQQDLAAARGDIEAQRALATKANEEASRLKQVAEVGSAELKRSLQQEHDRAESLAQELSTARTEISAYDTQARKASDQAAERKQAAESGAAELNKSLQQERDRADGLERDLAAAQHNLKTQAALAAKAKEQASEQARAAESAAAELHNSLQQERERAEGLERDLAAAQHDIAFASEVTRVAREVGTERRMGGQGVVRGVGGTWKDLTDNVNLLAAKLTTQVRNIAEVTTAVARGDLSRKITLDETQTALATKAKEEASERKRIVWHDETDESIVKQKQAAESGAAELHKSLPQERDKASQLERELASERKTKDASGASAVATAGQIKPDKRVGPDTTKPVAADQATVAKSRDDTRPNPEDVAESARLVARASVLLGQGDIGSARIALESAAEMGSMRASFTLAETYDPLVLPKWGAYGTRSDAARARDLYAKAEAGGIKEAKVRLEALARNAPSRAGGRTQNSLKGVGQ